MGRGTLTTNIKKQKRAEQKIIERLSKKQFRFKELKILHDVYVKEGFVGVKNLGYKYSKPNLVAAFARHLPDFVPQNGKPRVSRKKQQINID